MSFQELHDLAIETAELQQRAETRAFERTMSTFKVKDEVEQAFRQGLQARPECDDLRIEQIASHYGFTSQADMLSEEAAEYMVALNKLRRGKAEAYENIKEEVADVLIMTRQMRYLLGYENIDRIINEKLNRQVRRIEDEKAE